MARSLMLLLALVIGTGCAAPIGGNPTLSPASPAAPRAPGGLPAGPLPVVARQGAGDLAVVRVGDSEIRRSDLGDFVMRYFRDEAAEALTHLTDERILLAEAEAFGIEVPESEIRAGVERELEERERTVRVQFGPDMSLEKFLGERYGVTLTAHRSDLTRLVRTRLLRDRVIRFENLRSDRVELRDAVFLGIEDARAASKAARGGADLAVLARKNGVRPHTVLPLLPVADLTPAALATAVASLGPGDVSDPIPVEEDGRTLHHVFKLVRRVPAETGGWPALRGEIEEGLRDRPIEGWEYLRWSRRAREKYRVEVVR